MSKTYHASYNKPGCPASITFHTPETEAQFRNRATELGLTRQDLIDKVLNRDLPESH